MPRSPGSRRRRYALPAAVLVVAAVLGVLPALAMPSTPVDDPNCAVDALLVNSCRPWLGAAVGGYPDAGAGERAQIEAHETRIGQRLDIVHVYAGVGQLPLAGKDDRYFATRPGTILFQNWKPARRWADAAGGDPATNARIDRAAQRIKSLAPHRIFLTLHHEPENDVDQGSAGACTTKRGRGFGSPADYVAMWRNVRARFDAAGVRNVVWVMTYMNYARWDCLVPLLYPGDRYVDWLGFDAYRGSRLTRFDEVVGQFARVIARMDRDTGSRAYRKPWMLAEWGVSHATQEQAYAYDNEAREAVERDRFPQLAAYVVFDHPGPKHNGGLRIGYADDGTPDLLEVMAYQAFARAVVTHRND